MKLAGNVRRTLEQQTSVMYMTRNTTLFTHKYTLYATYKERTSRYVSGKNDLGLIIQGGPKMAQFFGTP